MKRAIIYVRVSTDEQAEKGYSLTHQEERLRLYCQHQNIEVVGFYREDHSAKSFNRPAFTEMLAFLKKHRKAADLLLFLKWDRFSRNAGDAYGMINQLAKLGVEPQAIEQPLDLSVPENKIMLAFYLAAPEVENDRRSLNTIAGMRRALKEGRYVTVAPRGYKNTRDGANKPIIVPNKDGETVRWIFEMIATGVYSARDIWRQASKKGLKVGRNNLYYLLRNPIYMGKVFLPAYKDEDARLIKAIHEPLISEKLFYDVQDVLNGKRRTMPATCSAKEELPLRGFLQCPKCGNKLTGSGSSGNGGKYFYYHCNSTCGIRFKAAAANSILVDELEKISANNESIVLFNEILKTQFKNSSAENSKGAKDNEALIAKHQQRIANAQQMMVDGEITPADYREIKGRYEPEIRALQQEKADAGELDKKLNEHLQGALQLLQNLRQYYVSATLQVKQKLIGSMFAENLVFENNQYRTITLNSTVELICRTGAALGEKRKGLTSEFRSQPYRVSPHGLEPWTR